MSRRHPRARSPRRLVLRCILGSVALLAVAASALTGDEDPRRAITSHGAKLLEAGRLEDAYTTLLRVHEADTTNVNAQRNLALVWASRGRRALAGRQGDEALVAYDAALQLHPSRVRYHLGRGRALFLLGEYDDALDEAETIREQLPAWLPASLLAATVLERQGRHQEALELVDEVAPLLTTSAERAALARRRARLAEHLRIESDFLTDQTGNFTLKYDASVDKDTLALVRQLLEDAYLRVTSELALTPRTAARVVIYTGEDFSAVRGGTTWAGALYDNGTLRLPAANLARYRDTAARVLAHEFTHHVLRERTPHLSAFWHEGIAQWQERTLASTRRQPVDLAPLAKRDGLLSLQQIRTIRPTALSAGAARLYYAQSLALVEWLVREHGRASMSNALIALGTTHDFDVALESEYGRDEETLFAAWVASLK